MRAHVVRRLAACACLFFFAAIPAPAQAAETVTLLIWEEFISPKVLATLENREGLAVTLLTFTTPEAREKLLREKRSEIDIVVADTVRSGEYQRRGILEKLDSKRIPAMRHSMKHWRTGDYAVPYLWGHTGIAWRTDKVDRKSVV